MRFLAALAALSLYVIGTASVGQYRREANDVPFNGGRLQVRQTAIPAVPPQCQTTCDPVNTLLQNNCAITECCTQAFESEYVDCYTCVATALNLTDFTVAQQAVGLLVQQCTARGFPITEIFFPGQDPATNSTSTATSATEPPTSRSTVTSLTFTPTPASTIPKSTISVLSSDLGTGLPNTSGADLRFGKDGYSGALICIFVAVLGGGLFVLFP